MAIPLRGNMALQPHVSAMKSSPKKSRSGFTLLEIVIALLMIGLLFGMVFSTSRAALDLGNNIVKTQNEEMLHQAFFDLLEKRFTSLPGNTRLDLKVTETPSHYLSDLTLENVPLSFTWGNQERTAKAVQLSTVMRRSGFIDIVLRYYENPILDETSSEGTGSSFKSSSTEEVPFAEITLLTDVRIFEWRVLNPTQLEYEYVWDESGKLPIQLELTCAFGADGEPMRHIFWIPPKQNPEVFMRQLQGSARNSQTGAPQNPSIVIPAPNVPPTPVIPTQ
jgi:prepilin-type N-terminal cleavage/methylation domain-containing protein